MLTSSLFNGFYVNTTRINGICECKSWWFCQYVYVLLKQATDNKNSEG